MNLNFKFISTDRVSEDDVVKPGTLISGVVERVTPNKIIISVDVNGYTKGTLSPEHLADNQGIKWLLLFITHFSHLLFFFFVYWIHLVTNFSVTLLYRPCCFVKISFEARIWVWSTLGPWYSHFLSCLFFNWIYQLELVLASFQLTHLLN